MRAHLVADVPVSSFLSGGLDSSIVTVLAKQANPQIDAYTITFRAEDQRLEAMPDDAVYARKVAQRHGIDLHEIEIRPDVVDLLPRMVDILDEPIGDPAAINTLLMSEAARAAGVKVLLSGMGADELFGGYRKHVACVLAGRYRELPAFVHRSDQRRRGAAACDRGGPWPSLCPLGQAIRDLRRAARRGGVSEELQPVRLRPSWRRSSAPSSSTTSTTSSSNICRSTRTISLPTRSTGCAWRIPGCFFPGSTSPTPTEPAWPRRPRCACRSWTRGLSGGFLAGRARTRSLARNGKIALKRAAEAWLPQRDRPPAQGVLLGAASGVGDPGPDARSSTTSLLGGELVDTGFLHRPAVTASRRGAPGGPRGPVQADLAAAHARAVVPPDPSRRRGVVIPSAPEGNQDDR